MVFEGEEVTECDIHLHYCIECDRIIPCRHHPDSGAYCGGGDRMNGRDF